MKKFGKDDKSKDLNNKRKSKQKEVLKKKKVPIPSQIILDGELKSNGSKIESKVAESMRPPPTFIGKRKAEN